MAIKNCGFGFDYPLRPVLLNGESVFCGALAWVARPTLAEAEAPCLALNLGLDLLMTYTLPLRRIIWQLAWRFFWELKEGVIFIAALHKQRILNMDAT